MRLQVEQMEVLLMLRHIKMEGPISFTLMQMEEEVEVERLQVVVVLEQLALLVPYLRNLLEKCRW